MSTTPNRPGLHPMLWVAAASITAVSLAGVAKLTGLLPDFSKPTAPEITASGPAQPAKPLEAPPPIAAAETTPALVAEQKVEPAAAKVEHAATAKPVAAKPKPHPKSTQAAAGNPPPADAIPAPADAPAPGESAHHRVVEAPAPTCRDCGVIEHIEAVQQKGEGSGLGAVGGAILGGVLGNQIGEGSGKKLARIGGAVLGGFAGNEAERRYRTVSHYQITVRLEDGTRRVIEQQSAPVWREGDAVRVQNGEILPRSQSPSAGRPASSF